jgi:cell division protease FtsH
MLDENQNQVTFADVAGVDEAKEEVAELVDFLRDPSKFQKLGGRIPRGVLMVGSPGTGKTLLARAIAGEAKVPFFSISGSDFVEMFVGVGARARARHVRAGEEERALHRVHRRDRRGRPPARRGPGRRQRRARADAEPAPVEMDGFEGTSGVIVIAATNRPDVLDPALLRPGRFDRQVVVPLPDIRGREQILLVHMRKVPIAPDVDASIIARGTPGFLRRGPRQPRERGGALRGARQQAPRRHGRLRARQGQGHHGRGAPSMVMPEEERRNTAYHESGHAIVARLLPKTDPVHKVTIIPRGRALGVTMQLPRKDRYSYDADFLRNNICVLFGGRIAEELFMNQMTTGASNDFKRATEMARRMVTEWGMSERWAPWSTARTRRGIPRPPVTTHQNMSEETMKAVDQEVRRIIDEQYALARKLLEENRDKVEAMTKALLEWETIDADQIHDIMAGRPPRPPKPVANKPASPPIAAPRGAEPDPSPAESA